MTRRSVALSLLIGLLASGAVAQTRGPAITLPSDPRAWINSPPLSMESLSGKGVVFYFFDEDCPRCAAGWESVQALAASYQDKPVLFVAVNSGTSPRELGRYLSRNRVSMPVIQDPTREFENAMRVPQLSLQTTTYALRYVSGDGSLGEASGVGAMAFRTAAESALKGAEWRVDPAEVHPSLRVAWRAIELGDFATAARPVSRAAEASEGELKESADKLLAAVEKEADAALEAAASTSREGDKWKAYQAYESLANRFDGYEIPAVQSAEKSAKSLAKTDAIRDEIAAARMLDKAIARGSVSNLKKVGVKYPATEAATRASQMLAARGN